jgi:hypothetical protein
MPTSVQPAACAVEAFAVQDQADVSRGETFPGQCGQDRFGVCHLGYALGIHEARHFDTTQAGVGKAAYEFDLRAGFEHLRLALQAITWPHFHDLDAR